jgi:hypothetical protein
MDLLTACRRSGEYFAYMISKSGSDWNTIKIKPTHEGTALKVRGQYSFVVPGKLTHSIS